MSKRLQVLIGDVEYKQFQRLAKRRGMTVAEWVRQALRAAFREEPLGSTEKKLAVVRAAVKQEFPTADIDRMLDEISAGYGPSA